MILLNGLKIANKIQFKLNNKINNLIKENRHPKIGIILIGDNLASLSYIKNKIKFAEKINVKHKLIILDKNCTEKEVIKVIHKFNVDESIDGILLQMPIPKALNLKNILKQIDSSKDVEAINLENLGSLFFPINLNDENTIIPCTVGSILKILNEYNIKLEKKHIVIVGTSLIIGKPLYNFLISQNCTLTICNKFTTNINVYLKNADVIISATGTTNFINKNKIKKGIIVIDVGFIRTKDNKITGDVDYNNLNDKIAMLSPVPNGLGPITVACIMENLVKLYLKHLKKN